MDDPIKVTDQFSQNALRSTFELIQKTQGTLAQRDRDLGKQIEELRARIEKITQTLNRTAYELSSILIHEGSAQWGHYYAYIFDPYKGVWRRFSDL